jgi:hypothetical protein
MKKLLLSVALIGGLTTGAYAQMPVIDIEQIRQGIQELTFWTQQVGHMESEVANTLRIVGNLERTLNPMNLAGRLLAEVNPMPEVGEIASVLGGSGGFGSLAGIANRFANSNTYYQPGTADFVSNMLQRSSSTLSGLQAMNSRSLTSLQDRMDGINDIRAQLAMATSQADLAALQTRLQAEMAMVQAQQVQAQSIYSMAHAQHLAYEQMVLQRDRESADALLVSAQSDSSGAPGTLVPDTRTNGIPMAFAAN